MSENRGERVRRRAGLRAIAAAAVALAAMPGAVRAETVRVVSDEAGQRLQVDGRDFLVKGMNWDYYPIGTNYNYSLWTQSDDVIREALENEMPLLKAMGVNAIRQYAGIPPGWVRYIHDRWGIWTVLNHPCARYGITIDGVWIPSVNYADPRVRDAVSAEVTALVEQFRGVPGVLMWLLGNENNYGLSWTSFEAEALPEGERDTARARQLYSLYDRIIREVQDLDPDRPVAIANGDIQYLDVIAEECPTLDVLGTNVYRGISVGDLFDRVRSTLGVPVLFTEFGSDAFNARTMREDQVMQARYLVGQWREIYGQTAGKGGAGNAIGGLVFQWSDGWWKFRQDENLEVHDTNASWPNGGYSDFVEGDNNMNEEWWGICAKGTPDARGLYELYPRAAYYALRDVFALDAYAPGTDAATIGAHFGAIEPAAEALRARGDRAALLAETTSRLRVSGIRVELETYSTGGERVTTPDDASGAADTYPAFRGFDRMQSFWVDFEGKPAENVTGTLSLSILGHVPVNPIDEIFYENRGRPVTVQGETGPVELNDPERVKVYEAAVSWQDRRFDLEGFYRTGHYHWGYEGDFFGLYREANYGENIDIYNGEAPVGVEIHGKRELDGLAVAMGPELWWGANPAVLVKADRRTGPLEWTAIYQDDLDAKSGATSSNAIPVPPTRKGTLQFRTRRGPWGFEAGGIWSGDTKVGELFQIAEGNAASGYRLLQDRVLDSDTFGGKAKITWETGRWHAYAQGAWMGLVADGGPTETTTYTGWSLKDSGSGNQRNVLAGVAIDFGTVQVAPNFLWQKPIVGPVPGDVPDPGRPRNVLDDPFAVRANRETVGGELLVTWDPTPATWFWAWDNDVREDAGFAASFGYVFRHLPTTQDAAIGILADGRTTFPFPGATPPRDLWELRTRIVSRMSPDVRLVANLYGGTAEPNGDDPRLLKRGGGDARLTWSAVAFETFAKFNDWGPYDYHRDFNLTFPVQLMGDVSYSLGMPRWFDYPQTRLGVRTTWRSLDRYSPRYCPGTITTVDGVVCDPNGPGDHGNEWEIRTYLHFSM